MRTLIKAVLLGGTLLSTGVHAFTPVDGHLDPTFSGDGKVRLAFDKGGNNFDLSSSVVATPTGAYVFGQVETGFNQSVSSITRLKLDGSVDAAGYGTNGTVYVDMLDGYYDDYVLTTGAIQADGKLVAGGSAKFGSDTDMLVCRFLTNGQLDENFGEGHGCATFGTDNSLDFCYENLCSETVHAIAIQTNQRVVFATAYAKAANSQQFPQQTVAAVRLNASGNIDTSFTFPGQPSWPDGMIRVEDLPIDVKATPSIARILFDESDRPIIGYTKKFGTNPCRMNTDPMIAIVDLDLQGVKVRQIPFDQGGSDDTCAHWQDRLIDMELVGGFLFVGVEVETSTYGDEYIPAYSGAIAKFDISTFFDEAPPVEGWGFQGTGMTTAAACEFCGWARFNGFARQPNGNLLLAGYTIVPNAPNDTTDAFVIRLTPDGQIDQGFGDGSLLSEPGRASYGFDETPEGSNEFLVNMTLQNGQPLLLMTTRPHGGVNMDMGVFRLRDDRIFWNDFEID